MRVSDKKNSYLILMCWLVYVSACVGRYCYAININLVKDCFSVNNADAGLVSSLYFFAYAIGQVINGVLCVKYDKRFVIGLALSVSAFVNLSVFLGLPFVYFKYFFIINGVAQSFLWTSLICLLAKELDNQSLSKAVIIIGTTGHIGKIIIICASSLLSVTNTYIYAFLFGASFMAISGILWMMFFNRFTYGKEKPTVYEEKEVSQSCSREGIATDTAVSKKQKTSGYFILFVLVVGFIGIAANLVNDGLMTWVPTILKSSFGLNNTLSMILSVVLAILAITGSMLSSFLYNLLHNFMKSIAVMFFLLSLCVLGVLMLLSTNLWMVVVLVLGFISILTAGTNNTLVTLIPLYMRKKANSGKISGIINGFCYVGSTISSYGLGSISDAFGWNGAFVFILIIAISVLVFSIGYNLFTSINKKAKV